MKRYEIEIKSQMSSKTTVLEAPPPQTGAGWPSLSELLAGELRIPNPSERTERRNPKAVLVESCEVSSKPSVSFSTVLPD